MIDRQALVGAGAAVGYAVAVLAVDPLHGPTLCPLKLTTGLDCPGCGSTRASWLLLHGDVGDAARHNVLLVAFVGLLAGWWLHLVAPAAMARLPAWARSPGHLPGVNVAVALLAYGVLRNVPPLDAWLAPPT